MKKIYAILLSFSLFAVSAQTPYDAVNYSQEFAGATARSAAMGGAFGAVGGDFSSLSINPAGIGVYRAGELSITPVISHNNTRSSYLNLNGEGSVDNFNINNLGIVFTVPTLKEQGLVSLNFGFGYNRLKDFYRETYIAGDGSPSSLLNRYASDANASGVGTDVFGDAFSQSSWGSVLGWNSYLLDHYDGSYIPVLADGGVEVDQDKVISERGKIDEWVFSLGGNVSHKFYFGATLGLRYLDYTKESIYTERFGQNEFGESYVQYDAYNDAYVGFYGGGFESAEHLSTNGYGLNLKAGFIYRPIDALRVGLAFHTPTYYNLSDTYAQEIDGDIVWIDNGADQNGSYAESPISEPDYKLHTGLKMVGSLAYFIGKRGMLSLDYELSDKTGMRLYNDQGNSSEYLQENMDIQEYYKLSHAVRIGGEFRIAPTFSLRGGYALYASPYTNFGLEDVLDRMGKVSNYTLGFGYRDQSFFFDVAYVLSISENRNQLYYVPVDMSDPSHLDNFDAAAITTAKDNRLMFTVGFKF